MTRVDFKITYFLCNRILFWRYSSGESGLRARILWIYFQSHLGKYFLVGARERRPYGGWTDLIWRLKASYAEVQFSIYILRNYRTFNIFTIITCNHNSRTTGINLWPRFLANESGSGDYINPWTPCIDPIAWRGCVISIMHISCQHFSPFFILY